MENSPAGFNGEECELATPRGSLHDLCWVAPMSIALALAGRATQNRQVNHFRDFYVHEPPLTAALRDVFVKILLALLPIAEIAVTQTTIIKASITAYSTAVGPSSA
jgi:hypothetical protein